MYTVSMYNVFYSVGKHNSKKRKTGIRYNIKCVTLMLVLHYYNNIFKRIFRSLADVSSRARFYNFRANRTNGYRVHLQIYDIIIRNVPLITTHINFNQVNFCASIIFKIIYFTWLEVETRRITIWQG